MGKFRGSESKIVANSRKSSDMRAFAVTKKRTWKWGMSSLVWSAMMNSGALAVFPLAEASLGFPRAVLVNWGVFASALK